MTEHEKNYFQYRLQFDDEEGVEEKLYRSHLIRLPFEKRLFEEPDNVEIDNGQQAQALDMEDIRKCAEEDQEEISGMSDEEESSHSCESEQGEEVPVANDQRRNRRITQTKRRGTSAETFPDSWKWTGEVELGPEKSGFLNRRTQQILNYK